MNQPIVNGEPTMSDVLDAVNTFANKVEKRFDRLEVDITTLKSDVSTLKSEMKDVRSNMVTKDDLIKEHAKLKGDIILTMRKGDKKLGTLVNVLHEKKVIDDVDVKRVVSMEPFPQLSV